MKKIKEMRKGMGLDPHIANLCVIFILCFLGLSLMKGGDFLKASIFQAMMYQFPEYGLLALGVMFAMISGGIDLSTVGVANLTGILSALWMGRYLPRDLSGGGMALAVAAVFVSALLIGLLCGALSAFLIYKINIPAFISTIGTLKLFGGIGIGITGGQAVGGIPEAYAAFFQYSLFGVLPVPVLLFAVCGLLAWFLLNKTSFGVYLKLQGSNEKAACFAGVKKSAILLKAYMFSGCMSAVSGLIMLGRMNSAKADYGASYTLLSILICVLGGVNPSGGKGRTGGVVLAVITLQLVSSGMALFRSINTFYNLIVYGLLLLAALLFDYYYERKENSNAS